MRFATETEADDEWSWDPILVNLQNLVLLLKSERQCAFGSYRRVILQDNPLPHTYDRLWEVRDKYRERNFVHKLMPRDEIIKVEVDIANTSVKNDEEGGVSDKPSFPLVVGVYKKHSELMLEFAVTAYLDKISVDNLSFKIAEKTKNEELFWRFSSEGVVDASKYESKEEVVDASESKKVLFDVFFLGKWPSDGFESEEDFAFEYNSKLAPPKLDFQKLDQKLQEAFLEYLDRRGINHITTKYLYNYIVYKYTKEYLNWVEELKVFMEDGVKLMKIDRSEEDF